MQYYHWILVLHILAIISWMAGVLYHYRILIYLVEKGQENEHTRDVLQTMARKLYRYISMPAMGVAILAGASMIYLNPAILSAKWMHVKLLAVAVLIWFTVYAGTLTKRFVQALPDKSFSRTLRWLNEGPTVAMIVIVIMVKMRLF